MSVAGWGRGNVTLIVEVDFSQAVDDISVTGDTSQIVSQVTVWDVAVWDDADYPWASGTAWTDVSQWTTSVRTRRAFSREVDAYDAGQLTLTLDNTDGRFSSDNTSSPYRLGGSTTIGILRPVRVRAIYQDTEWFLFYGRIETWDDDFGGGFESVVTVTAVDSFADLAAFDSYEQTPAGAGETYGARVQRILDNAGWEGEARVDVGENTMQATSLASNALTELKLVADSEGGVVWAAADGALFADGRNALIEKARSNTVQATFSDTDDETAIGYELNSIGLAYDGTKVVNIAAYARVGSTQQIATSPPSRALYGDRQVSRTDLVCETDAMAAKLAERTVSLFQAPERRVESLRFSPMLQPTSAQVHNAWYALAHEKIDLRHLVLLNRNPVGGYSLERYLYVRGIEHTITPDRWNVDLSFSSATVTYGLVDSRWDVGLWDTANWSF